MDYLWLPCPHYAPLATWISSDIQVRGPWTQLGELSRIPGYANIDAMTDNPPPEETRLTGLGPVIDASDTVDGRNRLDTILTALINNGRVDDAKSTVNHLLEKDLPPLAEAVVLRAKGGQEILLMNYDDARESLAASERLAVEGEDWASAISANLYQMSVCVRLDDFAEALRVHHRYQGYHERYLEDYPESSELAPVAEIIEGYLQRLKE